MKNKGLEFCIKTELLVVPVIDNICADERQAKCKNVFCYSNHKFLAYNLLIKTFREEIDVQKRNEIFNQIL